MKTYNDFLNFIRNSNGQIVTIIQDSNWVNNCIIKSFKKSLSAEYIVKSCEYSTSEILYQIENVNEKTILFINSYSCKINRNIYNKNNNLILIFIKKYYSTYESTLMTNDINCFYISSLIFLLKNKQVKIIKNRYGGDDYMMDMTIFERKEKLLTLDKISKK